MPPGRRDVGHALLLAVVLVGACARGLAEPGPEERAALAAAATVPAAPSGGCRPGTLDAVAGVREKLVVDGEERSWLVDAPAGAANVPRPLVVSFHGFRSSAWRHRWWTGFGGLARRAGFIAVHPEGHEGVRLLSRTGRGWDIRPGETRDLDFLRALLTRLEAERCVDRGRIHLTGMSNGGFFASLAGCALADRVAAAAPVAGAMPLPGCTPSAPVPVLLVHGAADRVIPAGMVQGAHAWWAETNGCGAALPRAGCAQRTGCRADVIYCEGPQGHRWPGGTSERVWRFFEMHPRAVLPARDGGA